MAVLLACYLITPGRTLQKFNISKSFPAEEMELTDISGNRVKLSDHRGFPVILYMWNSMHPYPAEFLAAIESIYKATKNPKVSFIALDRSNNAAKLRQFIDANKTDYPTYTAAAELDENYSAEKVPFMYLINKDGIVTERFRPMPSDQEKIVKWVRKMLKNGTDEGYPPTPRNLPAPVQRAPDATPKPAEQEDNTPTERIMAEYRSAGELRQQVSDLAREGKFDELDKLAASLRGSKAQSTPGIRQLEVFYESLDSGNDTAQTWEEKLACLSRWVKLKPGSITARVFLGRYWVRYAWHAKGGGTGKVMPLEQRPLFEERLRKAKEILQEAETLSARCPMLYSELQVVAMGEGWNREDYDALFRRAVQLDPDFLTFYKRKIEFLMPYWHGKGLEWTGVLDEAVEATRKSQMTAAYALLVSVGLPEQLTNNKQIFDTSRIAWPKLRESFIDAVSLHPDSLRLLNKAALYASMRQDKEIAKSAFAGIGDNYDPHIWKSKPEFKRWKLWSEQ